MRLAAAATPALRLLLLLLLGSLRRPGCAVWSLLCCCCCCRHALFPRFGKPALLSCPLLTAVLPQLPLVLLLPLSAVPLDLLLHHIN
jgi:hypothetical protein